MFRCFILTFARYQFCFLFHSFKRLWKKAKDTDGHPNPFKDNMPGNHDWFSAFMVRNPWLSFRKPQGIGKERAVVTPGRVDRWFSDLESHLAERRVTSILYEGRGMFNCDESGFTLGGCTGNKVLAEKDQISYQKWGRLKNVQLRWERLCAWRQYWN